MRSFHLVLVLLAVLPQSLHSQTRESLSTRTSSGVQVIRGSGDADGVERADMLGSPSRLTADQTRQLLAPLGLLVSSIAGPWRVTAGSPLASGRVSVEFANARAVVPARGFANLTGGGSVFLGLRPLAANEQYLVSCSVYGASEYKLYSPGGSSVTFNGTNTLSTVFISTSNQPATFRIASAGGLALWTFHGCDVSLLQ